ncbi:MAG TPA: acetyl-CoA carboxylase biotin carboxyl carrier protein subunit [Pyrinomonadaceae bacterium]|nr:acetyl-CoA carboxylase biotin carboxyl carrier protein subunit [Pyrinomonadaceae bacterium]
MRLKAELSGETYELSMRREGARVFAEVGGRRYELEARAVGAGEYLLVREGRVYECRVGESKGRGSPVTVSVGAGEYEVTLTDPKHLRGAGAAHAHDAGRAQVVAPMPGKVVRVLVEAGQQVEAGQGVVVVEAMKMQNELKSPKSGTVAGLRAEAGATVNAGDVLAVIE